MKLYLSEGEGIEKKEIVGIFDMDSATVSPRTQDFLRRGEREGRLTSVTEDVPVSFVVSAERQGNIQIYLTRNAPRALRRRAERFLI